MDGAIVTKLLLPRQQDYTNSIACPSAFALRQPRFSAQWTYYYHDVIFFGCNMKEHCERLVTVLLRLREHNLRVKLSV